MASPPTEERARPVGPDRRQTDRFEAAVRELLGREDTAGSTVRRRRPRRHDAVTKAMRRFRRTTQRPVPGRR